MKRQSDLDFFRDGLIEATRFSGYVENLHIKLAIKLDNLSKLSQTMAQAKKEDPMYQALNAQITKFKVEQWNIYDQSLYYQIRELRDFLAAEPKDQARGRKR